MEENKKIAEPQKKRSGAVPLLAALVIILLIAVGFLFYQNNNQSNELENFQKYSENLKQEKENVTGLLEEMLTQYDTLSSENEQLNAEIEGQKAKIEELMAQVEKHKDDQWLIYKYRKEAETLRDIMKGYVVTIDSLNTLNKELTAQKLELQDSLGTVSAEKQQLESQTEEMAGRIATGSVLHTTAISSEAIRVRSNGKQVSTNKAKNAEMIKTCFSIGENRITDSGTKELYLRIISPDGKVLASSDGAGRFQFNGVEGEYSVKREVNYQNTTMDVCMFWTVDEPIGTGQYIVEVYESAKKIGEANFDLK